MWDTRLGQWKSRAGVREEEICMQIFQINYISMQIYFCMTNTNKLSRVQRGERATGTFAFTYCVCRSQGVYIPPTPEEVQAAEGLQRAFR